MATETVLTSLATAVGMGVAAGVAWWRMNKRNGQRGTNGNPIGVEEMKWRTNHEKDCRERWENLYAELSAIKASVARIEGRLSQ